MARDEQSRRSAELIDENLKQIFQKEVERELPDRFTHLIEQLRAKDASSDKNLGDD